MQHSSRNIQTDRNYKQPSGKKSVHGGFRLVNSRQQYIAHSYDKRTDDMSTNNWQNGSKATGITGSSISTIVCIRFHLLMDFYKLMSTRLTTIFE